MTAPMTAPMTALLAVSDLTVAIGGQPRVQGVSFALERGEILGLIGESGSGKSLTALSLLGLAPPGARVSGSLRFKGEALPAQPEGPRSPADRAWMTLRGREIGMVFQEPMTALNPLMGIGDQVAETVRLHRRVSRGLARAMARDTLERVGLPARSVALERYPHELSGGQRQRVAVALAIILAPSLIIADEPTTALDVTTQAEILQLLCRLVREDGCSLLLVSHDLGVVAEHADRVAVMARGRLVESGLPARVLARPADPYTRELVAASLHGPVREAVPQDAPVVLRAEGVTRHYRSHPLGFFRRRAPFVAVDGVSLQVRRGEIVGLIGESGSGKSTLLRALLALESLQGGAVWLGEAPFARAEAASDPDRELRRRVQVVFQDPAGSFNPRWRVARIVAEPFHLLADPPRPGELRRRVAEALERVGLRAEDGERYPHEFSGGQRQRIALARALVTRPDLIILDEAVSALDVAVRARILDLIADLNRDGQISFLFVSHDLGVIRAMTDRVYVMRYGRIVESGATNEVLVRPGHPYTRSLLSAMPDLPAILARRHQEAGA